MKDILLLTPAGTDRFGRPCFTDMQGRAYVDIDYQRHPRTNIATKYPPKDIFYGEPDIVITGRENGLEDIYEIHFTDQNQYQQ